MRRAATLLLIPLFFLTRSALTESQLSPEQAIQMMRAQAEQRAQEEDFQQPKKPQLPKNRAVKGSLTAPITIVEYSDFQCPYCSKGAANIEALRQKYGKKIVVMFKHLPLPFHPHAMPAAQYYEAIAIQSTEKAHRFHDAIFQNQREFTAKGVDYLESTAKGLGVKMEKLKKDLSSDEVKKRIDSDISEAKTFGFSGTPGYVVAGVRLFGAYPVEAFSEIIDRRLAQKK